MFGPVGLKVLILFINNVTLPPSVSLASFPKLPHHPYTPFHSPRFDRNSHLFPIASLPLPFLFPSTSLSWKIEKQSPSLSLIHSPSGKRNLNFIKSCFIPFSTFHFPLNLFILHSDVFSAIFPYLIVLLQLFQLHFPFT